MLQRSREARARLRFPPRGIPSSELDVISEPELRRRRIASRREAERAEIVRLRIEAIEEAAVAAAAHRFARGLDPTLFDLAGPRRKCREIARACCQHFGITVMEIVSKRRTKNITYPRHVAWYLTHQHTTLSLPEIGRQFGDFDHTSVIHGSGRIEAGLASNEKWQADVAAIRAILGIEVRSC
jgi:chromosomal replication initiation ATPase DnaA